MLQALREKTSGWIAAAIVAVLAVPFAFFGMEQYLFQSNATYAAKVEAPPGWWKSAPSWWPVSVLWERKEIGAEEFREAFEQLRQQRRRAEGDAFDARAFETPENKREVLEGLIDRAVLQLAATRNGIVASDTQVRQAIEQVPEFQVDGRFDPQRYQLAVQSQGQTPQMHQQYVREILQQAIVPSQLAQSAFVTDAEVERMLRLLGERRDVSFVILPTPDADTAAVSGQEIQDWHAAHAHEYRAPETVTIEYVDIDGATLPPPAAPDDAALRARYEQEKSRFVDPERRLVSHVLVPVEAGADAAAQKAAEEKARAIAAQARQPGADFAALARDNPGDPVSAANGGDLGWIARDGSMVKPFEDAVFAAQAGNIGDPVRTEFGWHVILVREVRQGQQVPFESVRDTLAAEQAETDRERAFNDLVGRFVDEVYKNPTSLESAAEAANLQVQKTGPFARGQGSGVAAIPAVVRAAFSEALIQDGTVSDPIEISPTRTVLIRVAEHAPERALTIAEARDRIVAAIRADRARKRLEAEADGLVARLGKGEALAVLAAERGLEVQTMPGLTRGMPIPDPQATEAFFRASAPAEGKVSAGKSPLAGSGMVVFTVDKVAAGDPSEVGEQERALFRQQFSGLLGAEDAEALRAALRRGMKITVVESRL
jgi:peptidyl-prolyl cis-trans isomerase D